MFPQIWSYSGRRPGIITHQLQVPESHVTGLPPPPGSPRILYKLASAPWPRDDLVGASTQHVPNRTADLSSSPAHLVHSLPLPGMGNSTPSSVPWAPLGDFSLQPTPYPQPTRKCHSFSLKYPDTEHFIITLSPVRLLQWPLIWHFLLASESGSHAAP